MTTGSKFKMVWPAGVLGVLTLAVGCSESASPTQQARTNLTDAAEAVAANNTIQIADPNALNLADVDFLRDSIDRNAEVHTQLNQAIASGEPAIRAAAQSLLADLKLTDGRHTLQQAREGMRGVARAANGLYQGMDEVELAYTEYALQDTNVESITTPLAEQIAEIQADADDWAQQSAALQQQRDGLNQQIQALAAEADALRDTEAQLRAQALQAEGVEAYRLGRQITEVSLQSEAKLTQARSLGQEADELAVRSDLLDRRVARAQETNEGLEALVAEAESDARDRQAEQDQALDVLAGQADAVQNVLDSVLARYETEVAAPLDAAIAMLEEAVTLTEQSQAGSSASQSHQALSLLEAQAALADAYVFKATAAADLRGTLDVLAAFASGADDVQSDDAAARQTIERLLNARADALAGVYGSAADQIDKLNGQISAAVAAAEPFVDAAGQSAQALRSNEGDTVAGENAGTYADLFAGLSDALSSL